MEESEKTTSKTQIEFKFLKQSTHHEIPRMRYSFAVILGLLQLSFLVLYGFFVNYNTHQSKTNGHEIKTSYPS
jgi:hypothetical protein